jgi:hypothetical protein
LRPAKEWVLVQQEEDELSVGVYLEPSVLERLEGVCYSEAYQKQPEAWALALEGVSHFLLLFFRAIHDIPVSQLELELQAEVDKYVTARFSGASAPLLQRQLFTDAEFLPGLSQEERSRYQQAGRLASRYCTRLERQPHIDGMLNELRRFYRMSGESRLQSLADRRLIR